MDFEDFQQETNLHFRHFRDEDAPALVECIRDEYGENYLRRELFDPNNIIKQNNSGENNFLVAELGNGKIVGMVSLKMDTPYISGSKMYELASGIILKKYRHHGIIYEMFKYALAELRKMKDVSALLCQAVMFNDTVQKHMEHLSLTPCGFILSALLIEKFQHSYERDANIKHPLGVYIKKIQATDAGTIYIPKAHYNFAQNVYQSLGVNFKIADSQQDLHGESLITVNYENHQQDGEIIVEEAGIDLIARIESIHNSYSDIHKTFNVFLNVNHPSAITAYEKLRTLGYFFTGFKPLSNSGELLIMHNPCNVPIIFDTWKLSPKFAEMREYVKSCYNDRGV